MLEKMAEMVREDVGKANDTYGLLPCMVCDGRPAESERCLALGRPCPDMQNPDGSLMVARYAVLLVARALEKELVNVAAADEGRAEARFFSKDDDDRIIAASDAMDIAFQKAGEALYRLTHEAKEAAHE